MLEALINTHPESWPEAAVTIAIILAAAWIIVTILGAFLMKSVSKRFR